MIEWESLNGQNFKHYMRRVSANKHIYGDKLPNLLSNHHF